MGGRDIRLRLRELYPFVALLLVTVLASTGCGGSSKAAPAGSFYSNRDPAASRFAASADTICKRLNAELVPNGSAHLGAAELAHSALRNAALERVALAQLSELKPPASLAGDWKQIISYRRTLVSELLMFAQYVKSNDATKIRALAVSKFRLHQKLLEAASRDRFKDCSHVGPVLTGAPSRPLPGKAGRTRGSVPANTPNRARRTPG
jgi:hypothetical protein